MSAPTSMLRPALEAAVQVARAGETAVPSQPAPPMLRRYLAFARLPSPALDIARRVLDEDVDFRRRVAEALSPDQVGEPGWLWLTRPDGWEARLEELKREAQEREHDEREERVARDVQRKLLHAEDRARRAEAVAQAHATSLAGAQAELDAERAARRKGEVKLGEAVEQLRALAEQRNSAVHRMRDLEAELARVDAQLREAQQELRTRGAQLAEASKAIAALQANERVAPLPPSAFAGAAAAPAVADGLAAVIAQAARAADDLSTALASAAALLDRST